MSCDGVVCLHDQETLTVAVIGFILLVVATCSVPVNENLYLFELRGVTSNETSIARVGVLGLCGDFQGRQVTPLTSCSSIRDRPSVLRLTTSDPPTGTGQICTIVRKKVLDSV